MPQATETQKAIGLTAWSGKLWCYMQDGHVATAWLHALYRYLMIKGWLIERLHSPKNLPPIRSARGTGSRL